MLIFHLSQVFPVMSRIREISKYVSDTSFSEDEPIHQILPLIFQFTLNQRRETRDTVCSLFPSILSFGYIPGL